MKTIIIFSGRIARDLIQKEYKIIDIKPDKFNRIKTIFFFQDTEDLRLYLENEHNVIITNKEGEI